MRALSCAAALLALSPSAALAQALTAPLVGTSASGPVTIDPASVHWNPALLAYHEGTTVLASGGLVVGDIRYKRERLASYQREDSFAFKLPISPAQIDPAKTGTAPEARATPVAPTGSLFAALPLGKKFAAGIGVYAPYAAILKFAPGGPQRWALEEATIATLFITPAIAYRPTDQLSLGAGVSYVLGVAELSKIQDFATVDDVGKALGRPPINQSNDFGQSAPPSVRELAVMARPVKIKQAIAHGFTFNVGAALQPSKNLLFGLTYQHTTPLNFNGKFSLDMNNDFFTRDLASQGLAYKPRIEGDATLSFPLPRTLLGGARIGLSDRTSVAIAGTYAWWSQVESFDVLIRSPDLALPKLGLPDTSKISLPRRWQNTVGLDLSVSFQATPALRLWALGGYRSSATPDATIDVASPDGDRIIAALGGAFQLTPRLSLLGDFKLQTILPRTVVGSEYDLGNGEYKLSIYTFAGHLLFKI